jgi:hypothetical protein
MRAGSAPSPPERPRAPASKSSQPARGRSGPGPTAVSRTWPLRTTHPRRVSTWATSTPRIRSSLSPRTARRSPTSTGTRYRVWAAPTVPWAQTFSRPAAIALRPAREARSSSSIRTRVPSSGPWTRQGQSRRSHSTTVLPPSSRTALRAAPGSSGSESRREAPRQERGHRHHPSLPLGPKALDPVSLRARHPGARGRIGPHLDRVASGRGAAGARLLGNHISWVEANGGRSRLWTLRLPADD